MSRWLTENLNPATLDLAADCKHCWQSNDGRHWYVCEYHEGFDAGVDHAREQGNE